MDIFKEKTKLMFDRLGTASKMALATGVDREVSVRTISAVIIDELIYFQTDSNMEKAREILTNENVALCVDEIQIKGRCHAIGDPMNANNTFFINEYKRAFPGSFKKYSCLPNETVFEVQPIMAKIWSYIDGNPVIEYIDFTKHTYSCEIYNISGKREKNDNR